MLRLSLIRAARSSTARPAGLVFNHALRQPCQYFVRYESNKSGDEHEKPEVKPKTLNPTPVSLRLYPASPAVAQFPAQDAYLIDVREPDEVIQGCIPSAVNLPLSVLPNSLHLHANSFREKHGFEKPLKDQEIIFYCRTGKRSATACDVAKRNGFTNVYNYAGSWVDWLTNENPKGQS